MWVCVCVCASLYTYVSAVRACCSARYSSCCTSTVCCCACCSVCCSACCRRLICPLSALRSVAVCCSVEQRGAACCSMLQCVALCYSVLQCAALYCSVLQCILQHLRQVHTKSITLPQPCPPPHTHTQPPATGDFSVTYAGVCKNILLNPFGEKAMHAYWEVC